MIVYIYENRTENHLKKNLSQVEEKHLMSDKNKQTLPDYTAKLADVIIAERQYLQKRRAVNEITEEESEETWGLAISGGGVRSSIISLGFIRELMKKGFFRRFDYLSAVSSGSFIPAALASLLTGSKAPDGKFGVDAENSPFLPKIPEEVKMYDGPTATEQIKHFQRSRGFIPQLTLTGFNFNSLAGVWLGGWAFSSIIFVAVLSFLGASILAFLAGISGNEYLDFLQGYYTDLGNTSVWERFSLFKAKFLEASANVFGSLKAENSPLLTFLFVQGVIFSIVYGEYLRRSIKENAHQSIITKKARRYMLVGALFICSVIFVAGLFRGSSLLQQLEIFPKYTYWIVFLFPVALSIGMLVGTHFISVLYQQMKLSPRNVQEVRAAITGVKGANLLVCWATAILPPFILVLQLIGGFVTAIVAVACFFAGLYWTFYHSRISRKPKKGINGRFFNAISNLLATIIICFSFAGICRLMLYFLVDNPMMIYAFFFLSFGFNIFLFFFSQANRSNLHNYLKIKIYSAFLITSGRDDKGNLENLRKDSLIKMQELGDDNFSAPYLIINTAVNVHGSSEGARQERKAYPFIFTKHYCGSEVTNYARTAVYQGGLTKLQDAITNSAAIIHSGMGRYNFWAQSFLITALNLRLGAWIQNPLYFRNGLPGKHINYAYRNLIKEFLGMFNERARYVNVSNGVHSGDNFGLIPLIQRSVDRIVICDFTGKYQYLSLQEELVQTMTLAERYGIYDVEIDTTPIKFEIDEEGNEIYEECVRVGQFKYETDKDGYLYYVRSVLTEEAPKGLLEYQKKHESFPFEVLTKQNFEEVRFNSYLKLGEFLGNQFLSELDEYQFEKLADLRELADLVEVRIAQLEKGIGSASWKDSPKDLSESEVRLFNIRLELLREAVAKLVLLISELEKEDEEVLLETRKILLEKQTYLATEKAKMAGGAAKFQIIKDLEEVERELSDLDLQIDTAELLGETRKVLVVKLGKMHLELAKRGTGSEDFQLDIKLKEILEIVLKLEKRLEEIEEKESLEKVKEIKIELTKQIEDIEREQNRLPEE